MKQPHATEVLRLWKGDPQAGVSAARRRTHTLLRKGDPTAALVTVHEALKNLPEGGELPPELYADLRLQLLADQSTALGALAEEIYHGPRPPRPRRTATRRGAVIVPACCALAAVGLATAGRWAAAHLAGIWSGLAPVAIAFGVVVTLVATVALLAPPADRET